MSDNATTVFATKFYAFRFDKADKTVSRRLQYLNVDGAWSHSKDNMALFGSEQGAADILSDHSKDPQLSYAIGCVNLFTDPYFIHKDQ